MESKVKLSVATENLAVPEVHTGKVAPYEETASSHKPHSIFIQYETVAVPEIHISKK